MAGCAIGSHDSSFRPSIPFPRSLQALAAELTGNPHSAGSWGPGQPDWADALRRRTLEACGVGPGQYTCILTSGATAALKLVGETFPWHQDSSLFCHLTDNHNSVLGVRELAREGGARVVPVRLERSAGGLGVSLPACPSATAGAAPRPASLFAFPMESNFHGVRYGLELVNAVQACAADGEHPAWRVLLDAAKGAGTGPPDLAAHPADFVALSYYKLFGYPTGEGCRKASGGVGGGGDPAKRRRNLIIGPSLSIRHRRSGRAAGQERRLASPTQDLLWGRGRGGQRSRCALPQVGWEGGVSRRDRIHADPSRSLIMIGTRQSQDLHALRRV